MKLDKTDWKILAELQQDARLTYAEIGRRVGMSSPAVQERVRKLEDLGIIEGYYAKINLPKLGLPIMAITRISIADYDTIQRVVEIVKDMPEVVNCHQVTGEDEFIMQLRLQSMDHLMDILHQFSAHGNCVTSIVVRTNVSHRVVSLEDFPYLAKDKS